MAVRPILEYPDERLRLRAEPAARCDADLARLAEDLLDTLAATAGVALSAPQIGRAVRMAVIAAGEEPGRPAVYVNPVIVARSLPGMVEESCLSLPGIVGSVWRATRVTVRAEDPAGVRFERRLEGLPAVCLQHEIDHLDGKLFIDRLWPLRRLLVRSRLNEMARRAKLAAGSLAGAA